mgnify:CR=1 FL=1
MVMEKQTVYTLGVAKKFAPHQIHEMMQKGLEMLGQPDAEDSEFFKLRVVNEEPKVWCIEDGQAITLLLPEEY